MIEILLAVGVAVFTVNAAFNIAYLVSIKRTSDGIRELLRYTGGNLKDASSEFKGMMENMRKMSSDVREVTADMKQISNAVADIEKGIRSGLEYVEQSMASAAEANIAGLKAGVTTGVATLVQKAVNRKE